MYQKLLTFLLLINVIVFLVMGYDKSISMSGGNTKRIPEKTLLLFALAFGAVGIYLGMLAFRHKTRKWYFRIGIPVLILQNLATLYVIQQSFATN